MVMTSFLRAQVNGKALNGKGGLFERLKNLEELVGKLADGSVKPPGPGSCYDVFKDNANAKNGVYTLEADDGKVR